MIFPLLLMFSLLPLLTSGSGMDLAELSSVQYSVKIARDPVIKNTPQESDPSLTMVNMNGQKYTCSLPKTPDMVTDGNKTEDEPELDIEQLLSPLESAPCMFLTKDWWTYEVCYKRDIRQYHMEGDAPVGAVILLGTHNPDQDRLVEPNKTYHPQWYGNGSRCDLTGQMRQTEVRFVCNEGASQEFVGDILEHQSCEYRVFVHTSRLCGVARMRPAAGTTPALPIVCHPVLDQDQMDKYKIFKERSKLARQLKKQQRRQEQSLQLLKQMGPRQRGVRRVVTGAGAVDSVMEVMGDKLMEKIFNEVNTLLDESLGTHAGDGINEGSSAPVQSSADDQELKDGMDLHEEEQVVSLASLQNLIGKRNVLWDRILEARKTLEQYKTELIATESRLFSIKHTEYNVEKIAALEVKWRSFEVAVRNIHGNIAKLESQAKSVTERILTMKKRLKKGRLADSPSHHAAENNLNDKRHVPVNMVQVKDAKHDSVTVAPSSAPLGQTETISEEYEPVTEVTTVRAAKTDAFDEGLGGNIKISISKLSDDDDSEDSFDDEQSEKIVTKLEGMIKNKLSRQGLSKNGRPIEVMLITTRLPEGAENEDDRQLNSMFYNMMTGDVDGYEDINQVRKDEENYGFAWKEEMLTDVEQKIEKLKLSGADADLVDKMLLYATQQDDDVKEFWDKTLVRKTSARLDDDFKVNGDVIEKNIVDETLNQNKIVVTHARLVDESMQKNELQDSELLEYEEALVDNDQGNGKEESKGPSADSDEVPKDADIQDGPTRKKEL